MRRIISVALLALLVGVLPGSSWGAADPCPKRESDKRDNGQDCFNLDCFCKNGYCDPGSGQCGLPGGQPCTTDTQCASSVCNTAGAPTVCCNVGEQQCGSACCASAVCCTVDGAESCLGTTGACGNSCADAEVCPGGTTASCIGGTVCKEPCATGTQECGGVCVPMSDDANCGGCGVACPTGTDCVGLTNATAETTSSTYSCSCTSTTCTTGCCGKSAPSVVGSDRCYSDVTWTPSLVGGVRLCPTCSVPAGCGLGGCTFSADQSLSANTNYRGVFAMKQDTSYGECYPGDCPRIEYASAGWGTGTDVAWMRRSDSFLVTMVHFPAPGNYTFTLRARTSFTDTGDPTHDDAKAGLWLSSPVTAATTKIGEFTVATTSLSDYSINISMPVAGSFYVSVNFLNNEIHYGSDKDLGIASLTVKSAETNASLTACDGVCVDLASDPLNCGACDSVCSSGYACYEGVCTLSACLATLPGTEYPEITLSSTNDVACRLTSSSLAQSTIDNQKGEDQSFFFLEAGLPSMVIVIDNSASMRQLPMDPGCSVTAPGCNNSTIDSIFDMDSTTTPALKGLTKPDAAFPKLFDPTKFYLGKGEDIGIKVGCAETALTPKGTSADACKATLGSSTHADYAGCTLCLDTKGYYLRPDGKRVWKGGFLNNFPPKCVLARKLAKSKTLIYQTKVRYSVLRTNDSTVAVGVRDRLEPLLSGFWPNQCGKIPGHEPPQYVNNVNNINKFTFGSATKPLAEAIYNAGQLLQNEGAFYDSNFTTAWTSSTYDTNTYVAGAVNNKVSVCSSCQKSAIVVLTDGKPKVDSRLPKAYSPLLELTPVDATGACKPGFKGCKETADGTVSWAASVSKMLNQSDLRSDIGLSGTQSAQTFVIALGTDSDLLKSVAQQGGGEYFTTYNSDQLEKALRDIIDTVGKRAMSVSAPSLSTVQTKSGSSVVVPRFIPSRDPMWMGELYKFQMFSEFAVNCAEPGKKRDKNGLLVSEPLCICREGTCDGLWIVDKDDDVIATDPMDGSMVKANTSLWDDSTAYFALKLDAAGKAIPAVPVWAAGEMLQERTPMSRTIYTAIDSSGDGQLDGSDTLMSLRPDMTDLELDKVIPYLALGYHSQAGTPAVCQKIQEKLRAGGIGVAMNERTCARIILGFIHGLDVFNSTGTVNPTTWDIKAQPQSLPNRAFVLGDIFHASAVRVDPPVSRMPLCERGFHNQCLRALYSTSTEPDEDTACGSYSSGHPYERYVGYQTFTKKRPSVTLIGANDGMVHAFQYSCFSGTDAMTSKALYDESPEVVCAQTGKTNGSELWAFVPPDLLHKLSQLIVGATHPYMIDSTAMIRDIWVDGGTAKDGKKACDEYKTVAIFGERRGGTRFSALDVTDPINPRFLWTFPKVGTPEELTMGESWSDYLPGAPPIGPVRIKKDDSFEERWVVMLGGGFDPARIRGNQLYMLDAYTGAKLWEARLKAGTTTEEMKYPFAAMPALVAWGPAATTQNLDFNGGFFDTAIVGDLGGQVWVARFNEPGELGANPYNATDVQIMGNWRVARAFQEAKAGTALDRPPFFSMAAAVRMSSSGGLQAYLGSGDRFNLKNKTLGLCTIDNPMACARQGLAYEVQTGTVDVAVDPPVVSTVPYTHDADQFNVAWSLTTAGALTRTESLTYSGTANACAGKASPVTVADVVKIGPSLTGTIDYFNNGLSCTGASPSSMACVATVTDRETITNGTMTASTVTTALSGKDDWYNRFVSFRVFRDSPFVTAEEAVTYDTNRLTETDLRKLEPFATTPAALASETDHGWYFAYPAIDEATATNTTIYNGCVLWSTLQATPPCFSDSDCASGTCVGGGCFEATSDSCAIATGLTASFLYQANSTTGGPDCGLTGNPSQRSQTQVLVPPPPPQEIIQVNTYGQYKTSVAPAPGMEAPPASIQTFNMLQQFGTIEVPRNVHECRHRGRCDQ